MTHVVHKWRVWAFVGVCVMAGGGAVASLMRARHAATSAVFVPSASPDLPSPPRAPFLMVRNLPSGPGWGHVALVPLAAIDGPRYVSPLACMRVHYAGGRGLCLTASGPTGQAIVFDERLEPRHTFPLTGAPSRARVSRDGRRGAVTVFEQGHGYSDLTFSTRTTLFDLAAGTVIADLEQFRVVHNGQPLSRPDFNYWGVTFADDGNRFFATLAFGGTPYLVEGDVAERAVRVLVPGVECPSLAPSGARIAFKRPLPLADGGGWRLWVLDLASKSARPVAGETRSIDDQVEWLDDTHILYQYPVEDGNHVWSASVDDAVPAQRYLTDAWSPTVVR